MWTTGFSNMKRLALPVNVPVESTTPTGEIDVRQRIDHALMLTCWKIWRRCLSLFTFAWFIAACGLGSAGIAGHGGQAEAGGSSADGAPAETGGPATMTGDSGGQGDAGASGEAGIEGDSGTGDSGTGGDSGPDAEGGTTNDAGAPPIPTTVPTGFVRAFTEDFDTPAALGSFDSVYGTKFGEYTGCCSTNQTTVYDSSRVLTVSNGSLFYNLHSDSGVSYAAAPQPGPSLGFTYGQYGLAVRLVSSNGHGYKIAFLLWPTAGTWTNEVDFPEVNPDFSAPIRAVSLNTTTANGTHTFSGPLDTGYSFTDTKYHTFLLDWAPGKMEAYIDGALVESFPAQAIPSQAMRLSLQAEGWINSGPVPAATVDVIEVPWVYINTYQ